MTWFESLMLMAFIFFLITLNVDPDKLGSLQVLGISGLAVLIVGICIDPLEKGRNR